MRQFITILVASFIFASCAPPRISPQQVQAQYDSCATQTINALYYMGSDKRDHHIHHMRLSMRRTEYRVSRSQLRITDEFPLTDDRTRWLRFTLVPVDAVGSGGFLMVPTKELPLGLGPFIEGVEPARP